MATNGTATHRRAIIGSAKNFWLHSSSTGFDLTHPSSPDSQPVEPRVMIKTSVEPITIDPAKSALVVIDMQNFFLSAAFGRSRGAGHGALDQLVEHAIPAAREAGIRIIWLNWGLTDDEIENMPPAVTRAFGFEAVEHTEQLDQKARPVDKHGDPTHKGGDKILENGKPGKHFIGLGSECGAVEDPETGKEIDAGRMLVRDTWNAALQPPLNKMYEEGAKLQSRPDVWIHKNRMSGMWNDETLCEAFLKDNNVKTLLFTGVNTDQCVGGTLTDSFSKGYDCIMLGTLWTRIASAKSVKRADSADFVRRRWVRYQFTGICPAVFSVQCRVSMDFLWQL